jgi:hypothetical protein
MKRFVIQQNIEHFREMLKMTTDPAKCCVIEKLLLKEEAKLKKLEENHKKK